MAIEIVDFPIENGGSFHSYVSHYQRVHQIFPSFLQCPSPIWDYLSDLFFMQDASGCLDLVQQVFSTMLEEPWFSIEMPWLLDTWYTYICNYCICIHITCHNYTHSTCLYIVYNDQINTFIPVGTPWSFISPRRPSTKRWPRQLISWTGITVLPSWYVVNILLIMVNIWLMMVNDDGYTYPSPLNNMVNIWLLYG